MQKEHHNSTRRSISSRRRSKKRQHRVEVSSGGLVYKKTPNGVDFAMLKDSFGKWTFPKGHVKKGESYVVGAAREIEEEMGLASIRKIRRLGQIDIWFRDRYVFKGKLVHKFIYYFLFESKDDAKLVKPKAQEKGEKIQAVAWVPAHLVEKRSAYKDMRPIVKRAFEHLRIKI